MKTLTVSVISLLLGVIMGLYFEHRYAERKLSYVIQKMQEPVESGQRLAVARGLRAITLLGAGDTSQALQLFSFPVAEYYCEYVNLPHNDGPTKELLGRIEQFGQSNQVVASQIKFMETNIAAH